MKSSKPTSTALARVLALPLAAGLLAGCDYASKLPDAPTTLGYELQSQKPPSVTAPQGGDPFGPPPAVVAPPPAPTRVAQAPAPAPRLGAGLNTQALRVESGEATVPRNGLALPPSGNLPRPGAGAVAQNGLARSSTVGQPPARDLDGYAAPPSDFQVAQVPQLGAAMESGAQFPEYAPVPFDNTPPPAPGGKGPVAIASLPADSSYGQQSFDQPSYELSSLQPQSYEPPAFEPQPSTVLYSPEPLAQPLPFDQGMGQGNTVATTPLAAPMPQMMQRSQITVLHTRLDNGAIVRVHPVVGAPGQTSGALAQTIASELGASVDSSALAFAPAVFDLRASASRAGERPQAEWKLFSATGALVGTFPESQSSGTWETMGNDAVQAMGRRVADRMRRNADLRRATLTSLASAPPITSIDYSSVLPSGAPSLAPMPRQRPVRMAQAYAPPQPVQTVAIAAPQPMQMQPIGMQPIEYAPLEPIAAPAPVAAQAPPAQYVVDTGSMLGTDSMANAIPRRRPQGVRTAALSPSPVRPAAPAPQAVQRVAPMIAPAPAAPIAPAMIAPPAPSFDTLRAAVSQPAADGPRSLVFRGVRGAPGNGDQALGREVSRLLGQSGANLAPNGTPNALYLTADVSRSRAGGSDRIKILWHVEEEDGTRVGQVVQENDVPAGALDASWGEDAFYAAQGARDGIMELLRTSGAIDA